MHTTIRTKIIIYTLNITIKLMYYTYKLEAMGNKNWDDKLHKLIYRLREYWLALYWNFCFTSYYAKNANEVPLMARLVASFQLESLKVILISSSSNKILT